MPKKKPNKKARIQMNLDERFRQLRTNIEFSQYDRDLRVINVVSTFPDEGKSTVALNLAKIYGNQYYKVLLIDCDLRNPSLHKLAGVSNEKGLSNLLTHFDEKESLLNAEEIQLCELDQQSDVYMLTAGSRVPNPQELLASQKFVRLVQKAKEEFSTIIIDCPPCMAVADAIPVCNASDGTLYVVSAKDTDKASAREGMNELRRNGANIIGAVLTKAEESKHHKNGYYYYDYGYGYGYGEESEDEKQER